MLVQIEDNTKQKTRFLVLLLRCSLTSAKPMIRISEEKAKIFFAFSNESTFGEANVSENLEQNKIILIIFYAEMHLSFVSRHLCRISNSNNATRRVPTYFLQRAR